MAPYPILLKGFKNMLKTSYLLPFIMSRLKTLKSAYTHTRLHIQTYSKGFQNKLKAALIKSHQVVVRVFYLFLENKIKVTDIFSIRRIPD